MLPFHDKYTEKSNFCLCAAIGKRKWQTCVCFLLTENGKCKFVFLGN